MIQHPYPGPATNGWFVFDAFSYRWVSFCILSLQTKPRKYISASAVPKAQLANHSGPESCGGARKSDGEALTGEGAGRVLSRERYQTRDADAVRTSGRQQPACRN